MKTNEMNIREKKLQTEGRFYLPETRFAATCGDCYWNDDGWCRKYGGWVDADKWACNN